jgi:hypothetical protein
MLDIFFYYHRRLYVWVGSGGHYFPFIGGSTWGILDL